MVSDILAYRIKYHIGKLRKYLLLIYLRPCYNQWKEFVAGCGKWIDILLFEYPNHHYNPS